jgi:hypothetical protein
VPDRRPRPPRPARRATHRASGWEPLEPRPLLAAAPRLVADINQAPADSEPSEMAEFRGALYYANNCGARTGRLTARCR